MKLTAKQLGKMMFRAGPAVVDHYLGPINTALAEAKLVTKREVAHFIAQLCHETGFMSKMSEDLFYKTPERLMKVWPSRFKTIESAMPYVRNSEKLANFVYAGRMGNGVPESGDGYRHRGAGGFQLTGKTNQLLCAAHFNVLPAKIGDWLRTPEGACRSAAWFFVRSGAVVQANLNNIDKVSDIINLGHKTEKVGDSVGFAERKYFTELNLRVLEEEA
jgi:putative chitinase